jgi:GNAT superfamily N-acetyltransferase
LDELKNWSGRKGINQIFLGTFTSMHAAHRFYKKNGFSEIKKEELPATFPLVSYDNMFFTCNLLE